MAILFSDNMTRADSTGLGAFYDNNTADSDPGGFDISSNAAVPHTRTQDSSATNNTISWPNDQYAKVVFGTTAADGIGSGSGVVARSASAAKTFYRAVGNASGYELARFVTASFTSLSSGAGTTFTLGDSLILELHTNGANVDWILKKNGVTFVFGTDTSPLTSGRTGLGHSSTTSVGAGRITAFESGDFTAGGVLPIVYRKPQIKLYG